MMDEEDQGYTRIKDGCYNCPYQVVSGQVVRVKFIKQKSPSNANLKNGGPLYWVCPKCGGYYGEVQ